MGHGQEYSILTFPESLSTFQGVQMRLSLLSDSPACKGHGLEPQLCVDQMWSHLKFRVCLGCMRPCLKTSNTAFQKK